jgi:hypothetical protein
MLEDEFWSSNWDKIKVNDSYMIFDQPGLYFNRFEAFTFSSVMASAGRPLQLVLPVRHGSKGGSDLMLVENFQ